MKKKTKPFLRISASVLSALQVIILVLCGFVPGFAGNLTVSPISVPLENVLHHINRTDHHHSHRVGTYDYIDCSHDRDTLITKKENNIGIPPEPRPVRADASAVSGKIIPDLSIPVIAGKPIFRDTRKVEKLNRLLKKIEKKIENKVDVSKDNPKKASNGSAIAGMVLGILGFLLFWIPFLGLILSILGLVFSNKARKRIEKNEDKGQDTRGKATATIGLIFSIIGLSLSAILLIFYIIALAIGVSYFL